MCIRDSPSELGKNVEVDLSLTGDASYILQAILPYVGDVNGLGACLIADLINDLVRLQLGVAVHRLVVVLLPAADLLHPELVLGLFDVGQNGLQNVAGVAGQA